MSIRNYLRHPSLKGEGRWREGGEKETGADGEGQEGRKGRRGAAFPRKCMACPETSITFGFFLVSTLLNEFFFYIYKY